MDDPIFIGAAMLDDVPPGGAITITLTGRELLLCNDDGQIFAIGGSCSHAGEPLLCGRIKYGSIACPAHGARFDLESGEPLTGPATEPIETFPVRITGNMIEVSL